MKLTPAVQQFTPVGRRRAHRRAEPPSSNEADEGLLLSGLWTGFGSSYRDRNRCWADTVSLGSKQPWAHAVEGNF